MTLHVILNANPDSPNAPGRVEGRLNGNGVDLNRNWDCNWKRAAVWRRQPVSGGAAPFSEVESQALRDFLLDPPPAAVVFWHSALPGVLAGGCGAPFPAAVTAARVYAEAAGYPYLTSFAGYDVTGDASDWLALQNISAIVVELSNHADMDWEQNLRGMLAVLNHYARSTEDASPKSPEN